MNSPLLILDVDETLIYASNIKLEQQESCKVFDYFVYERPNLRSFLNHVSEHFKIAIWSSASDDYVAEVIKNTLLNEYEYEFVWGRSRATYRRNIEHDEMRMYGADESHFYYVKTLKKVKKLGYDLDRVLIVDDSPHKSKMNYGNAIYPSAFVGNIKDDELGLLSKYLNSIKDCPNFRRIEKRNWRNKASKLDQTDEGC